MVAGPVVFLENTKIMIALFIFMLVLMNSSQTLCCRLYSMNYPGEERNVSFVYSTVTGIAVAGITFAMNGCKYQPTLPTLLLGMVAAVTQFLTFYAIVKASSLGSYSFVNICVSFGGSVIPLFFTVFVFGEKFRAVQIAGIVVTLISFLFFNRNEEEKDESEQKKISSKYLLYCTLGLLSVGIFNVVFNMQKELLRGAERQEFTITIYLLTAILCILSLWVKNKKQLPGTFKLNKQSVVYLCICSLILSFYMKGVLTLFGLINPAIYYVVGSSGCLAVAAVFSRIIFKERFTTAKIIGVVLAAGGAALLSM